MIKKLTVGFQILSLCLILSGCTSMPTKAIQGKAFEGKPFATLVQAWGIPDSMVTIQGNLIYSYKQTFQRQVLGIERLMSPEGIEPDFCKISFLVEKEMVVRYTWEGNRCL